MNAHDREMMDRQIHRARLANLADDPPELGEAPDGYVARMIHVHGTTYRDAAVERYRGAGQREARAAASARAAITRAMKPGT